MFRYRQRQRGRPMRRVVPIPWKTTQNGEMVRLMKRFLAQYNRKGKRIQYVFWTGGFDSTYVILKMLLDRNEIVQPIYLKGHIDNARHRRFYRHNRNAERHARQTVRMLIRRKYPNLIQNLLPTIEATHVPKNELMTTAFQQMKVHQRRYNQYEAMARFAKQYGIPINIGVIGIEGEGNGARLPRDRWGRYLRAHLKPVNDNHQIMDANHVMSHLRFPIAYTSKRRALKDAKERGYAFILRQTWSCWFPKDDGLPCGKCPMCRQRIIQHPTTTAGKQTQQKTRQMKRTQMKRTQVKRRQRVPRPRNVIRKARF